MTASTSEAAVASRQIAVIAAIGAAEVRVHRRPRIGVLSTGSELVDPGTPLESGQIVDSNAYLLVAACTEAGAVAERLPRVLDDEAAFRAAIDSGDLVLATIDGEISHVSASARLVTISQVEDAVGMMMLCCAN